MIRLSFPDGSIKTYEVGTTGLSIAEGISKTLAKKCVAVTLNGVLSDLTRPITQDASIVFITSDTDSGLEVIRHDMAHVFAQAIKQLYPQTQITIGPAIQNGFYYDIHHPSHQFNEEDFPKIEERMHKIIDENLPFVREVWTYDQAIAYFTSIGESFKVELIESIRQNFPDQELSVYKQGDFIDLCRGPHMPSTGYIPHAFKLMKVAGAYWRGDSKNPMLQRIYGLGFLTQKDLDAHLIQLEEAAKRDHRRLGVDLDLFHLQDDAVGHIFWHPKGWTVYQIIESYMRKKLSRDGYVEVKTPQMLDRSLWEKSGHWEKFKEAMFVIHEDEHKTLAVKPMSCPGHVQIFRKGIKSYRDLPLRMAEFGCCHRNEPSGGLHGIMRTRAFTQDDGHIFCEPSQIISETILFCNSLKEVYRDFGFEEISVKFSDRPKVRAGDDEVWDIAEDALKKASDAAGLSYTLNPGEGAFYGPKLEFVLKDSIGREWQCGTLQVDFVLPERLDASYIDKDGVKRRPVMLHRAIFGSFERFIGILIEHYGGKLPLWIAPIQVVVAPISESFNDYATEVCDLLKQRNVRANLDVRPEKISYKVREHSLQKIPYIFIVGAKEAQDKTVSVRKLGEQNQKDQVYTLEDALNLF